MPAARFRGGSVTVMLTFILQDHLRQQHVPCKFASETDIEVSSPRVVRADAALVWGSDLAKFDALKFDDPRTDWRDYPLKLPPTLVIESISRGHELHDRRTKFRWYAEFGVQHYWIVDAYARRLDCLVLDPPSYRTDASGSGDEQVQPPAFPGLKIELRDVWG